MICDGALVGGRTGRCLVVVEVVGVVGRKRELGSRMVSRCYLAVSVAVFKVVSTLAF